MATIIKRLAGPAQVSNAAATKYTVPAATKARIRQIHIQNPTGTAVLFTLSIGADAAGTRLFDAVTIPANTDTVTRGVVDYWMDQALEAAEIVQAFAGTNNVLTLTISGEERPIG